ncbi:glycosyltransferase [Candidatus Peregrinibacteria bacterium]|jgi:glycosyltransferase involved in cell wall biosynthesis|nr:glycosyltransferase [Candidatus Peregrinibacteria bacterium]
MKVALVTDWLTNIGGAEKVLAAIAEVFPDAPIFTTVCDTSNIGDLAKKDIRCSFLQKIPVLHKKHQLLSAFLPQAIESLDLSHYDMIISFSSSVAKSVLTSPDQTHICYIHSPMRYAWEPFFDKRFEKFPRIFSPLISLILHRLRIWDKASAERPDKYIANSSTTQKRVSQYYRKESEVLYPPVRMDKFSLSKKKKDYFLGLGRMVAYKRFDLIAEAFTKMPDKKLILAGSGPEFSRVEKIAKKSPNIILLSELSDTEVVKLYSEAQGFILPQKEDAGIVQLEAMASGTPVIAYKAGGALDVIQDGENGVFFKEQTAESLCEGVRRCEKISWDSKKIRESVKQYDVKEFQRRFENIVKAKNRHAEQR